MQYYEQVETSDSRWKKNNMLFDWQVVKFATEDLSLPQHKKLASDAPGLVDLRCFCLFEIHLRGNKMWKFHFKNLAGG